LFLKIRNNQQRKLKAKLRLIVWRDQGHLTGTEIHEHRSLEPNFEITPPCSLTFACISVYKYPELSRGTTVCTSLPGAQEIHYIAAGQIISIPLIFCLPPFSNAGVKPEWSRWSDAAAGAHPSFRKRASTIPFGLKFTRADNSSPRIYLFPPTHRASSLPFSLPLYLPLQSPSSPTPHHTINTTTTSAEMEAVAAAAAAAVKAPLERDESKNGDER